MKQKIHLSVYEALTPRQRLAAAIAAQVRCDDAEIVRLLKSQPVNSVSLSAHLDWLNGLAVAVECDIREAMIGFFAVIGRKEDLEIGCLQRVADLREAWSLTMQDIGVHPDDAERVGPPHSTFLEVVLPHLPEPDADNVCILARQIGHWSILE